MDATEHEALRAEVEACRLQPHPARLASAVERLSMDRHFTHPQHLAQARADYELLIEQRAAGEGDDAQLLLAVVLFRLSGRRDRGGAEERDRLQRRAYGLIERYFVQIRTDDWTLTWLDVERQLQIWDVTYGGLGRLLSSLAEVLRGEFEQAGLSADPGVEDPPP